MIKIRSDTVYYRHIVRSGCSFRVPVRNFVFKAYDAPKETIYLANRKPNR